MSEERAGLDAREKGKARQRLLRWFRAIDNGALPPPVATASLALDAIEAEAVAAERVRLAEAVRALPGYHIGDEDEPCNTDCPQLERAAVLALLEPKP